MRRILTSFLFVIPFIASAQYTPAEASVESQIFKLSLISPGVEYELGLSSYTSVNAFAGVTPALAYNENDGFMYFLNPSIELQYRYYYNLRNRALKNKRTDYNSADFLAVHLQGTGNTLLSNSDISYQRSVGAGLVWGLQRTFKNGIYLCGYVGPGLAMDTASDVGFRLLGGVRIGYAFKNKADREAARLRRMERKKTR